MLANAITHADLGALELNGPEGDAVDIEHDIRTFGVLALDRDLFSHHEVVGFRVFPVDKPDRFEVLRDAALDLHPVTEQAIHPAVGIVE